MASLGRWFRVGQDGCSALSALWPSFRDFLLNYLTARTMNWKGKVNVWWSRGLWPFRGKDKYSEPWSPRWRGARAEHGTEIMAVSYVTHLGWGRPTAGVTSLLTRREFAGPPDPISHLVLHGLESLPRGLAACKLARPIRKANTSQHWEEVGETKECSLSTSSCWHSADTGR